jgi:hypothetical protein
VYFEFWVFIWVLIQTRELSVSLCRFSCILRRNGAVMDFLDTPWSHDNLGQS